MSASALSSPELPAPLRQERMNAIDFGDFTPQYFAPMHYPTEVDLYEPSLCASAAQAPPDAAGQPSFKAEVEVHLPCGYFNIWRPLHDRRAPVAARLAQFFAGAHALQSDGRPVDTPERAWDSRISYSSADDEYYENGHALPSIKGWDHGMMHSQALFRKVEHDWMMTYLAPMPSERTGPSVAVWRFNYVESRRVVDSLHAVLGFAVFAASAGVDWCIRPLSKRRFRRIPVHILTADETRCFPELASGGRWEGDDQALETRAQIIDKFRGCILAYREPGDQFSSYRVRSVPALAADLSEYVVGDHGFEVAVVLTPATEGDNRWQKAQVARQHLRHPVSGRIREGEDALARCGLDFRVRLRDEVPVAPVSAELLLARGSGTQQPPRRMAAADADFTVRVHDPENTVGSLQPLIRAHERVLQAGSEYFAALLTSAMAEAATKEVQLDDMPYGPVRVAINFLYADAIPADDAMDLADWVVLLGVASRLQIPRLLQICQARILRETQAAVAVTAAAAAAAAPDDSQAHYRDLAVCPEAAAIGSLSAVANETGAHDLLQGLERLVAFHPIAVCESQIRRSAPDGFRAQPTLGSEWQRLPDIGPLHLLHPHPPPVGPHAHDIGLFVDDGLPPLAHIFMPGPMFHAELDPLLRHTDDPERARPARRERHLLARATLPPRVPDPEPEPEPDDNTQP
ncbi:protein modification by small protein conjugation or removal [Coemansia spiralis]|nr:protein modification by small protein conjugation or removal [Coemansia spiralis]